MPLAEQSQEQEQQGNLLTLSNRQTITVGQHSFTRIQQSRHSSVLNTGRQYKIHEHKLTAYYIPFHSTGLFFRVTPHKIESPLRSRKG